MVFSKPGMWANLSIPNHREVSEGTLRSLVRTMGLAIDEFLRLVHE